MTHTSSNEPHISVASDTNTATDTSIEIKMLGQHLINGQWSGNTKDFSSFDPVQNTPLSWQFSEATEADIHGAAQAAQTAFERYRQTSPSDRASFLTHIVNELTKDADNIVAVAGRETGLPQARLQGELGRTCQQLSLFANHLLKPTDLRYADLARPERTPLPKADIRLGYLPIGPVAVFGASNFPLAFSTAGGDTASALAAGCPVIVKGHPAHPATTELVAKAILRAIKLSKMPEGVFGLIQGMQAQTATTLVNHPAIAAVGFTGSLKVGRLLFNCAAARDIPIAFFGELGATNPQVLLPSRLAEHAVPLAQSQVQSMMMGHGQFCTSPGIVIAVKGAGLTTYLNALACELATQAAAPMLSPGITNQYQQQTQQLIRHTTTRVIAQGLAAQAQHHTRPLVLAVDAKDFCQTPLLQAEVFGPYALVVECDSTAQMLHLVQTLDGQLTATVHGTATELIEHQPLIEQLSYKVGRIIFNQMPTGVEVCHSMNHGGPYPASTDIRSTSVGVEAMKRFLRPICYQNASSAQLPRDLTTENPNLITF